eukprot:TRINITY_DN1562_c0_g1_i1.p1 TRINITY_DN1562_c0_g1~~TRINITY_DN1562_c0_g1_i1.p1  ORF type:complete len:495 (+),score=110.98 TRINITY_DN1562_c0_g1_i1:106-1590(+)
MAEQKLGDGLKRVKEISVAPEHRQKDLSNDAWEALRAGIVACKKDDGPLNAFAKADAVAVLEFLCRHAKTKKMLKGRINECIKIALATETWTLAARNSTDELKAELKETLGDSAGELIAKLDTPPEPEPAAEGAGEEGGAEAAAEPSKDQENAIVMLENGRDGMREFGFEFPHDPLGTKLDHATATFMVFYEGMSKLGTGRRFETLIADGVNPFEGIEENFADILNFVASMAEAKGRGSYVGRVRYVVEKLQEFSPKFKDEVVKRGKRFPWEPVPVVSPTEEAVAEETPADDVPAETPLEEAPAEETPADETPAEDAPIEEAPAKEILAEEAAKELPARSVEKPSEPAVMRPAVVWIDFKREAFMTSVLRKMEGIEFRGFHDDETAETYEGKEVWLDYIRTRAGDPYTRVAVIVLNFKYLGAVKEVTSMCQLFGWEVPEFVMVTRQRSPELTAGGIKPNMVTGDWIDAARLASGFLQTRYALTPPTMPAPAAAK